MRTLYIMRHCKSRWDEADMPDVERKLSARGKRDARMMGGTLALDEPPPDYVVSSHARRALSTAKRVARAWGYSGEIGIDERLYEGTRQGCLLLLRELDDATHTVVLVGHNPHLEEMVFMLGDRALSMSTGSVVRIDVAVDRWTDLRLPADGTVRRVWRVDRVRS